MNDASIKKYNRALAIRMIQDRCITIRVSREDIAYALTVVASQFSAEADDTGIEVDPVESMPQKRVGRHYPPRKGEKHVMMGDNTVFTNLYQPVGRDPSEFGFHGRVDDGDED